MNNKNNDIVYDTVEVEGVYVTDHRQFKSRRQVHMPFKIKYERRSSPCRRVDENADNIPKIDVLI